MFRRNAKHDDFVEADQAEQVYKVVEEARSKLAVLGVSITTLQQVLSKVRDKEKPQ